MPGSFMLSRLAAGVLVLGAASPLFPATPMAAQALPSIADKTKGLTKLDGFIPLYWDAAGGKLWMEIARPGEEFLYITGAPTGLGSNDIGLDRGQIGGERVVRFERVGNKVMMVQPNYGFRAVTDTTAASRRAVEESFATSTLWGFKVEAETGGTILVDASEFAMRDVHNVVATLARTRQGTYRLDQSRSAFYPAGTKVFPRNTEIETSLTFTGDPTGGWIRDVAPSADAVTIRQRISLVALPEPGYEPRELDLRAGYFGVSYRDLTAPLGVPQTRQYIARHRLKKRNPGAAVSEPVAPIVYYLDRGAPEPIRTALLEGARWWAQAFEAAGYRNGYRVELLPEGADPMDVRYNVIQWVHRHTRGWSYGNTVTDPRTGEIIKGHVTLGSLRVRQDYMLAEGLLAPYRTGDERPAAAEAMALARLRQLSAHEVGHTLGIQHNYIASTANRASVMDYPHPVARLGADGSIDLSDAYATGIGEWDKEVVKYGYSDFPGGSDSRRALESMLAAARARGLHFLSDQDARPLGSAHPTTHLWDNGTDAVAELGRMLEVRRAALARFGEQVIQRGRPLAALEEVLVPLYLHHRYQVEAASKVIGGQFYTYAMRGDMQEPIRAVSAADQRRALAAVLQSITPRELAIPRSVLAKIPPRPSGIPSGEIFDKVTAPVFDALSPGAAATDMVAQLLFNPERAARLVQQHSLDTAQLGLVEVIDSILASTSRSPGDDPYHTALGRAAQRVVVDRLIWLAATTRSPEVRAIASFRLRTLADELAAVPGLRDRQRQSEAEGSAHLTQLLADITRYLERPWDPQSLPRGFVPPPGAPIGEP
jgi:hypothetical protein